MSYAGVVTSTTNGGKDMTLEHVTRSLTCHNGQRRYTLTGPADRVEQEIRKLRARYRSAWYTTRVVRVDLGDGTRIARLWCVDCRPSVGAARA